jgi:hypothetical protein
MLYRALMVNGYAVDFFLYISSAGDVAASHGRTLRHVVPHCTYRKLAVLW